MKFGKIKMLISISYENILYYLKFYNLHLQWISDFYAANYGFFRLVVPSADQLVHANSETKNYPNQTKTFKKKSRVEVRILWKICSV